MVYYRLEKVCVFIIYILLWINRRHFMLRIGMLTSGGDCHFLCWKIFYIFN